MCSVNKEANGHLLTLAEKFPFKGKLYAQCLTTLWGKDGYVGIATHKQIKMTLILEG